MARVFVLLFIVISVYSSLSACELINHATPGASAPNATSIQVPGLAMFQYSGQWAAPSTPPQKTPVIAMCSNQENNDLYVAFNGTADEPASKVYRYRNEVWTKLGEFSGMVKSMVIDSETSKLYVVGTFEGKIACASVAEDSIAQWEELPGYPKMKPKKVALFNNKLFVIDAEIAFDNLWTYDLSLKFWMSKAATNPQQYVMNVVIKNKFMYLYGKRYCSRTASGEIFETLLTVDQNSPHIKYADANEINGDVYVLFTDDTFQVISRHGFTFTKKVDGTIDYFWIAANALFVASSNSKVVMVNNQGVETPKPLMGGIAMVDMKGYQWAQGLAGGLNASPAFGMYASTSDAIYVAGGFDLAYSQAPYETTRFNSARNQVTFGEGIINTLRTFSRMLYL